MAHTDRLRNQRLRVLIVDDDADNAHVLAVLLQLSGHDTEFAFDGAHALQMARKHAPDVAFLDLQMPRMDGYELARQLRECLAPRNILLAALSGHGMGWDVDRCRAEGFDRHFLKPVEPVELLAWLESVADAIFSPPCP